MLAAGVLVTWVLLWVVLRGRDTLFLSPATLTPLHRELNDLSDAVSASRTSNPLFLYGVDVVRRVLDAGVGSVQDLIARPSGGRPVPAVGWLGVVAVATWLVAALGNLRVALLTAVGLVFLGLQGLWTESMDTLALTLAAVGLCLLIGIPVGIWAGLSERVHRLLLPVLDFMQTMPTFVYLAPLTLFFLIGPASATVATVVYALPPVIRLTAHGVRQVPPTVVEASTSLGATRLQRLRDVLLPMSKRTIVLGVNQTTMAALSMVTVAALIDAPGLGKTVVRALQTLDVGVAFNAGLAIVVLAIVLDRSTTAAGERAEASRARSRRSARLRGPALVAGAVGAGVAVLLSRTYLWAAQFPSSAGGVDVGLGDDIARAADASTQAVQDTLSGVTEGVKEGVTVYLLNPFEELLTGSPWYLVLAALVCLAALAGGTSAAATTAVGLGLVIGTGLWSDAMTTLASTVLATLVVLALGVVVGVWTGRSRRADAVLRPVLDAGQTMPAFVYLVPFLALFGASRFTAITAAVVFAAPVAIKIVADGVRAVPAASVEAATALGSTRWQVVRGVQLPMAGRSLALAANQGVIHVLSMVVVGGLVGAGALGYDVVAGFSQGELYGKGLAAGLAIVLLGTVLDRVTQAAARRVGPRARPARRRLHLRWPSGRRSPGRTRGRRREVRPVIAAPSRAQTRRSRVASLRSSSLAAALAVGLAGCGGATVESASSGGDTAAGGDCGEVNLAVNPWVGYEANAAVIAEVAESELGCTVVKKDLKEEVSWQGFGTGEVDAIVENWAHEDLKKKYIEEQKTAVEAGPTGNTGVIGWWVPPWMAQKYPDITDWRNLDKYASLFRTSESGGKGQLLDGDPSFVTNDEALVENLDLDFQVVYAGSEAALITAFRKAEADKTPLLGYFYDPQWFMSEVPLVKVDLPEHTEGCDADPEKVACDYPEYELDKILRKEFAESGSPAVDLIRNFSWTNEDQNVVARYIAEDKMSPEDAAKKWIADNPEQVEAWLS